MNKLNTFLGSVRIAVASAFMLMCALPVMADNRVYIENFSITPGETKEVAVMMTNDTPVSSLQFDVVLPEGLLYPENGKITKNTSRITRSSHTVVAAQRNGFVRFLVTEESVNPETGAIKGSSGTLFTIQLAADEDFDGGTLTICEVVGVDNTVKDENGVYTPQTLKMNNEYVQTSVFAGTFVPEVESLSLVNEETGSVSFALNNVVNDIVGLQADVVLPEGVFLAENEDGESFGYTDRLSDNTTIIYNRLEGEGNVYRIMISSRTNDVFYGNEGALFSLFVKGSDAVPADAAIEIGNVIVSTKSRTFTIECDKSVAVSHKSFLNEDVNRDGFVDINDVFVVLGVVNSDVYNELADVNADGKVDVNDIFAVISAILNN